VNGRDNIKRYRSTQGNNIHVKIDYREASLSCFYWILVVLNDRGCGKGKKPSGLKHEYRKDINNYQVTEESSTI
jgi:hypothetical protein